MIPRSDRPLTETGEWRSLVVWSGLAVIWNSQRIGLKRRSRNVLLYMVWAYTLDG